MNEPDHDYPFVWLVERLKDMGEIEMAEGVRHLISSYNFAYKEAQWQASRRFWPGPYDPTAPRAPWLDFKGHTIHHGDRLEHPDGRSFVAVMIKGCDDVSDAWRAVYDDATVSRLVLQIGDKGQAAKS